MSRDRDGKRGRQKERDYFKVKHYVKVLMEPQ